MFNYFNRCQNNLQIVSPNFEKKTIIKINNNANEKFFEDKKNKILIIQIN